MTRPALRYARWKAPAEDSQSLIWPAPGELLADTGHNSRLFSSAHSVQLQNCPLPEVRQRMRQSLGHEREDQPIIATGHQAELHHPGVWVKNALIDALATRLGGRAIHFAVDTDEPKHLALRWPGTSVSLVDDPALSKKPWSGLLDCPAPAHIDAMSAKLADAAKAWDFQPVAPAFLASMKRHAVQSVNLPQALTDSLRELDLSLGLRYDAMLFSRVCGSEPYLLLAHHILAHAQTFAADYNRALEEYRTLEKIRTPGRPMPNLRVEGEAIEVPFWLDDLKSAARIRAAVVRDKAGFSIELHDGERFVFDPAADGWAAAAELSNWLKSNDMRLAPRALMITAVLRLLVADQFVHGIGGGQYDQVLDRLIEHHFGMEPPRFCVTTATLYFPQAVGKPRACLPCVLHEGHRLRHSVLGERKRQWVTAIAAQPRHSPERSRLFFEMHDQLDALARSDAGLIDWSKRYADAQRQVQQEKVLFDRELFYGIQPADRLQNLVDHYRREIEAAGRD